MVVESMACEKAEAIGLNIELFISSSVKLFM